MTYKRFYPVFILLMLLLVITEQYYFWFRKAWCTDSDFNAILIAALGILTGIVYIVASSGIFSAIEPEKAVSSTGNKKGIWIFWGILSIAVCYEELRKLLMTYPPDHNSDVLFVMELQARKFASGLFPYDIVNFRNSYDVYPPYLPAFWIPMLIPYAAGLDLRWASYAVFAVVMGVFGYFYASKKNHPALNFLGIGLFSTIIWSLYFLDDEFTLTCTSEILIVAYYLLLMIGIYYDNLPVIIISLIACLLSRYNLLFWLPAAGILYFRNHTLKQTIQLILWVSAGVILLYLLPFVSQRPDILTNGFKQWLIATEQGWIRGAKLDEDTIYFFNGLSLNKYFCMHFPESSFLERIQFMQRIQMYVLLGFTLLITLLYFYFHKKLNPGYYLAGTLKIYFALFFLFNPMVYPYYLIPAFGMSIFLFVQMLSPARPS